ncbi:hypothetical protein [Polyangium mundeleinium]|uniref:Lipoprotein n=1 Tax=Polyangium mundeleinium TaxID=2995306 RepID=A0ABT5F007_9BACT|nr:hypothetical protein [Polyangium mundeleinium]MDC0746502.1 hypothetical protein [Polyangium mundeleinium]
MHTGRPRKIGKRARRGPLFAQILVAGAVLAGCNDVARFSTDAQHAYCGAITLGSPFREGLSPRVQMRLTLDATRLDGDDAPGRLWTFEAATETRPERRLLDGAELRPIRPLAHDPLSQFEMGEGRVRNTLFAVSPSEPLAEGMLAFLSLRSDGGVEVRLVRAGSEDAEADEGRRPIFGMFSLVRREGQCGF